MAARETADVDREVAQAARALFRDGSVDEAAALLRGALRRDPGPRPARALLEAIERGEAPPPGEVLEVDFGLVDRWIRHGMLVEALALLGGTPLGSGDKGREWANLLGELMAPVPVDAEDVLVQMHRQLMSGGASVALTLLEERERREPALPAWALRRLALLRWMLLDNARAQERGDEEVPPSELAGVLAEALRRGGLGGARASVEALVADRPDHRDAARALEALEVLNAEMERQVQLTQASSRTMPMVGETAGAMQLRMGNLANAASVYRRLVEEGEGSGRAGALLAEVEVLLAALAGEPLGVDELAGEATQLRAAPPEELPVTRQTRLPEESGPIALRGIDGEPDDAATAPQQTAEVRVEELVAEGRLAEAEELLRSMAKLVPDPLGLLCRADALRRERLERAASGDVLVRIILPVK